MGITEVETPMLKEALLAVQDVRRKYACEPMTTPYAVDCSESDTFATADRKCPLCKFQAITMGLYPWDRSKDGGECFCPWYWIEDHSCEEWTNEAGDLASYDDTPVPDRFARIDRWEAEINAELAKREGHHEPI